MCVNAVWTMIKKIVNQRITFWNIGHDPAFWLSDDNLLRLHVRVKVALKSSSENLFFTFKKRYILFYMTKSISCRAWCMSIFVTGIFLSLSFSLPKNYFHFPGNVGVSFSGFILNRKSTAIVICSHRFIGAFPVMPLFLFVKEHTRLDYFYHRMEKHGMNVELLPLQGISNKFNVTVTLWLAFIRKHSTYFTVTVHLPRMGLVG